MKVVFWRSHKANEAVLGDAFIKGVRGAGDDGHSREKADFKHPLGDVGVVVGVKDVKIIQAYQEAKKQWVYMDKGALRIRRQDGKYHGFLKQKYWKVSVNNFQPLAYMMERRRDPARWGRMRRELKHVKINPFRATGNHIILMGPSNKYSTFFGLGHPTDWCVKVIKQLTHYTDRPITYRPKHSWKDATPIEGTMFSRLPRKLMDDLEDAWCLVTHGSNSSAEAILCGVPVIALGPAITWHISGTQIQDIVNPYVPTEKQRRKWLWAMAYTMWSIEEMESGETWNEVRRFLSV